MCLMGWPYRIWNGVDSRLPAGVVECIFEKELEVRNRPSTGVLRIS